MTDLVKAELGLSHPGLCSKIVRQLQAWQVENLKLERQLEIERETVRRLLAESKAAA